MSEAQHFSASRGPGQGEHAAGDTMGENTKARYAIGLFRGPHELQRALAELQRQGWSAHHLRVIATAGALAEAMRTWRLAHGEPAACQWIACRAAPDGTCPWLFDRLAPDGETAERDINPLPGFDRWVPERQARQLDRHLRDGGGLLVARSIGEAEEGAACRTLLRYVSGGMQTHEVRITSQP